MKPPACTITFLAAALLFAATGPARPEPPAGSKPAREGAYWVETVNGSATVAPGGSLKVSSVGPVTLMGGAETGLRYTLIKRVRARDESEARRMLDRFVVRVGTSGGATSFELAHGGANGQSADLRVNLPRSLRRVSVETHGGDIAVSGLDGSLSAATGGGRMKLDRIGGGVEATTAGGEIELGWIDGPVKCATAGGTIRAGTIRGDATFETGGGEIDVGEVKGGAHAVTAGGDIHIQRAGADVTANTAGGAIRIDEARGAVRAETLGGSIEVGSASGVLCETAGGGIRLRNVSGSLSAATAVGNIFAQIARGRKMSDSYLATSSGDITILIPSNVALTIRAEGGRSRNIRSIVSEFPGIVVRGEGTLTVAEGSLNGGGPVLRLAGMGGTIFIKRQD